MKRLKSEKGSAGIDISVSVIMIFIFVSIVSSLVYQINSKTKEIETQTDAINLAINEASKIKAEGIEQYKGKTVANGNSEVVKDEEVSGHQGFYKTVTVEDYTDLNNKSSKKSDIVKRVKVKISYVYKTKEESVELPVLVSNDGQNL